MNNEFSTQSGNFISALQTHVDPRTGQFMAKFPLAELTGNNLMGPDLSIHLSYSPLNTDNIGFGTGFSFTLTRFNNSTNLLELSNGEQYRVMPGSDSVRNKKLDNFRFVYTNGATDADGYTVFWKEGNQEHLTAREDGTTFETTKIVSPLGYTLTLSWDWTGQYSRLYRVSDATTTLCQVAYGIFPTLTVWPETEDEYQIIFELIDSDSRLDVVRRAVSSSETLYWYFHYDLGGPGMSTFYLTGIDYPTGMKDRVIYNQVEGLRFPEQSGLDWLPAVISYTRSPGGGQPEMVTLYEYTTQNFLGYNGNFGDWSWDNDYLYTTLTDYTYGSTETLSDGQDTVTVSRVYNNYHLQVSEESRRQNSTVKTNFTYYAEEWVFIDSQPPQFQLPREQQITWTDSSGNSRTETTLTEFDVSGNPTREVSPDGTETLTTWYSAEGESGAPAEPNGFVRFIKEQTVTPPQTGFDAPVRRTLYQYTTLGETGHIVLDVVEEYVNGQLLHYRRYDYSQLQGQTEYGRLNGITDTKYDNTDAFVSQQTFTTSVSGGVMNQTATFSGHDALSITSARQQSVYSGLLLRETSPQNVVVSYDYDQLGRLLTRTVAPGTQYENTITWSYTLTSDGPVTTETDASGNQLKTLFDGAGRETARQQLDSDDTGQWFQVSARHYNGLGEADSGSGNDWVTGASEQFHVGMNTSRSGWGGVQDVAFTDGIKNYQDASPVTLTRTVYTSGEAASGTLYSGRNITQFDNRSQLPVTDARITVSGAALTGRQYEWDGAGRLRVETDERGNRTEQTYDAFDRVLTRTLPDGSVVTQTYAPHLTGDEVAAISISGPNADGNRQTWLMGTQVFDSLGRLTRRVSGGRVTLFSYEGASPEPAVITLPSGKTLQYTYIPELGNVISSMTADSVKQTFSYDHKTAELLNATEGGTESTPVWNPSGTLKNETFILNDVSRTAERTHTLNGEPVTYTDISGKQTRYDRDEYGRVSTITDDALNAVLKYDALGRLISQAVTDSDSSSALTTTLEYDDFGREIVRTLTDSSGFTLLVSQTWLDNDLLDTRTTERDGNLVRDEKYGYDSRNRLVSYTVTGSNLPPDAYGNLMAGQAYRYDAQNNLTVVTTTLEDGTTDTATYLYENGEDPTQLTQVTHTHTGYPQNISLTYDANGHMTRDEAGRTLEYDATGRLRAVSGEGTTGGSYGYDALNQLVSQNVSSADTRQLYYRDDERVNEVLVQQNREVRLIKRGGTCLGVGDDGSLTLTGNDINGSLLWSRDGGETEGVEHVWSPYGNGNPVDLLPGFNGERADPVSGSYHLGNGYRAYNPVLMRFNCPDSLSPFGAGGINPYAYCAGDPVNYTDPSGHISAAGWTGIGLGILGILGAAFTGGLSVVAASIGTAVTAGVTTGAAISATGAVAAAAGSASAVALTVGTLGVVADVTAIVAGATEDVNPAASSVLGWVSLGAGIAGVGAIAKSVAKAGGNQLRGIKNTPVEAINPAMRNINLHPENAAPVQFYKAFHLEAYSYFGKVRQIRRETGFTNNALGTGEPGLLIHGGLRGEAMSTSEGISTFGLFKSKQKKQIIFTSVDDLVSYLKDRHSIDLTESNQKLHLFACYAGSEGGLADKFSLVLNRKIVSYSPNEIVLKGVDDIFQNPKAYIRDAKPFLFGKGVTPNVHYPPYIG